MTVDPSGSAPTHLGGRSPVGEAGHLAPEDAGSGVRERLIEAGRRGRWSVNKRFVIGKPGNPMLERWRLLQTPLFGVYVHFIYREDLDPVPHDHPWNFWSLVLRGGYTEELHERPGNGSARMLTHHARSLHRFPLHHAHRIVGVAPGTVTLVIVGRKQRVWGFYSGPVWVDYRDALGLRPTEGYAEKRAADGAR